MRRVNPEEIQLIIRNVIGDTELVTRLHEHSALLGAIPEFDSMALVNLLLGMEEYFGFHVEDDEVEIEIFETVGTLRSFAQGKLDELQN